MIFSSGSETIHRIPAGVTNVYLVIHGNRSVLVDAGPVGQDRRVLDAISAAGLAPRDIALIVLTHTHYDHVGSLRALKAVTQAPVLVHTREAAFLARGDSPLPHGRQAFARLVVFLGNSLFRAYVRFHPVDPDIVIAEKYDLQDLGLSGCALPTPGHSTGSLSLLIGGHMALVGDTLAGFLPGTVLPPFIDDLDALLQSWNLLLESGCPTFLPSHGGAVSRQRLLRCFEKEIRKSYR